MSYILDALQRADAERTRGGVPTLHARPLTGAPLPNQLGARQRLGLTIAALVLVALGLAAVGWWTWQSAPTPVPSAVPTPTALPATAMPIAAPPVAAPTLATAHVAAVAITPPTPTPAPSKAKATAVAKTAERPAPAPAPTPALPPALAPLLSELPEAMRRQIPAMAISGAVYSDNPAQRLLLVNGQVLNQGSQVGPDLTVVEIHSNNSEFNFKGTRFRLAH